MSILKTTPDITHTYISGRVKFESHTKRESIYNLQALITLTPFSIMYWCELVGRKLLVLRALTNGEVPTEEYQYRSAEDGI
ncbi:hypothetical protein PoB_006151400 [Plakobranchus ocellatus]|uniref:Uncharacterized protein n=1 Tax=Plakobranchus ocellatus TaxID=259542 RepID=A0AAV4CT07_9GAST|nr:hypothetical protein PoB_006151400 [Plakobranchus ocellatus]